MTLTINCPAWLIRSKVPVTYIDAYSSLLYLACWEASQEHFDPTVRHLAANAYCELKQAHATKSGSGHCYWLPKFCTEITKFEKKAIFEFSGLHVADLGLIADCVRRYLGLSDDAISVSHLEVCQSSHAMFN